MHLQLYYCIRMLSILHPLHRQFWSAIGILENGQLMKVLMPIQRLGIGCSGPGENTSFKEHPVIPEVVVGRVSLGRDAVGVEEGLHRLVLE